MLTPGGASSAYASGGALRQPANMDQTNLEVVRGGYEAFGRGDFDWIARQMDPEIVWHDASEIPGARRRAGIAEVSAFLESFPMIWERPRFQPEDLHEAGDTV